MRVREEKEEGASEEKQNGWAMRSRANDRGSVSALREEKQKHTKSLRPSPPDRALTTGNSEE